ncbi:hypothetical protein Tco_1111718 [Tanacetum coccineum]|uniref:Uncharacterized protein n=1 Tax=Tanacetum coccineum TaxID=301880 RepID=A0ABQ5IMF6_9ASTR
MLVLELDLKVVPKIDKVSLVDGVLKGEFGGDGDEDLVMGDGVELSVEKQQSDEKTGFTPPKGSIVRHSEISSRILRGEIYGDREESKDFKRPISFDETHREPSKFMKLSYKKDSVIVKAKVERNILHKGLRTESSDEEWIDIRSEDECLLQAVRDFISSLREE